jgi:hypothetical protein
MNAASPVAIISLCRRLSAKLLRLAHPRDSTEARLRTTPAIVTVQAATDDELNSTRATQRSSVFYEISAEEKRYHLSNIAEHLAALEEYEELFGVFTDWSFLREKVEILGPSALLADCDVALAAPADERYSEAKTLTRLLRDVVQLSRHVLQENPCELATQIFGRLSSVAEPRVQLFLHGYLAQVTTHGCGSE